MGQEVGETSSYFNSGVILPVFDSYGILINAVPQESQTIHHPRPVIRATWRAPKSHSRPDLTLYTLTSDSVVRVFHPVLDAPQRLELHCTLDSRLFLPSPLASNIDGSLIFPLDRQVLLSSIATMTQNGDAKEVSYAFEKEAQPSKRLEIIKNEEWDLFLRILKDGSILIRGIANIDRRPPTLLRQFTVLKTPPSTFSIHNLPTQLVLSTAESSNREKVPSVMLTSCSPLATHYLPLNSFFDGHKESLTLQAYNDHEVCDSGLEFEHITRFVRTADGRGLGITRTNGGETWCLDETTNKLRRVGHWIGKGLLAVLNADVGECIGHLTALHDEQSNTIVFQNHFTKTQHVLQVPPLNNIFSLPSNQSHALLIGVTDKSSIIQIKVASDIACDESPVRLSDQSLPLNDLQHILPVDPMVWSSRPIDMADTLLTQHDALVTISADGLLTFWASDVSSDNYKGSWRSTGSVATGRRGIRMARCSSAQKTVLIAPNGDGEEITIWDSKQSQFSTGLEYRQILSGGETIKDLDWTSTDGQSILAIGYSRHVILLCQQRMTYFEQEPAWGVFGKVDISGLTPYPISDSIWLSGGSLIVGAAHQMFHYGQSDTAVDEEERRESLFESVKAHNGPLVDYHPQMLLQCLLWNKSEYVKEILVGFYKSLSAFITKRENALKVRPLLVDRILRKEELELSGGYGSLPAFIGRQWNDLDDDGVFSKELAERLIALLDSNPVPGLTSNEKAHLIVLIRTTSEVDEQRRALDSNGLRYLISMRSFYILNERTDSSKVKPLSRGRSRLRYRDMVWAFHSESQEILLNASIQACGGKMTWDDAKALGAFIWMESAESMRTHMENIARNEYTSGEERDPTKCSLFYFALGKARLVHGLWRQAAWHKEQPATLRFLANDFQELRWKTAALKNAYALLSKQRFAYSAAFFLLGGNLKDAVTVCVRQLNDVQLAIALARVVEQRDDGPVFQGLLRDIVLPLAFKEGNRYLCSWAFWKLHRRDFAVRVLVTPLSELVKGLDIPIKEVNEELQYDDPSLALLFSQLKTKTLQTAKGCHALALDLTASWSFERPSPSRVRRLSAEDLHDIPARPFNRHVRRRSSILIDMEIPSVPGTQPSSPGRQPTTLPSVIDEEEPEIVQATTKPKPDRQTGIGNLMKTAKQDVSVPEFDMNAFF
ncbi:hypothetical protein Clacol_004138 [Clathrus columnatus]|uniref:RAVE complex protein Rav1 C-terminal domain-containing protein n=1 Tax=Clathrus columnatus TaxID=1419009 RepID=A0AAV5A5L3_9AGAM|nr:hypothetical protein Clacol_004138 [Clathrus columnatus]